MAKGENIFKRKDGRWEARYIKGYDKNRKIQYGFCYGQPDCNNVQTPKKPVKSRVVEVVDL